MEVESYTFDCVTLPARRFELSPQELGGAPLVGDHLLDALRHPVFDACDLAADLLHVATVSAIAIPLAPQACVLVAKVGHRAADPAVETQLVGGLGARDLLAAVTAGNQD